MFFTILTGSTLLVETPFHFLFGFLLHGAKSLPPLLASWRMTLLPLGDLVLAIVLIHRFVSRCLRERSKPWRLRHTLSSVALLLLGCAAAIALSGVVHQAVWLMSDPWIENRGKKVNQTVAVSNARQLMLALTEFHLTRGHYPNSLQELTDTLEIPSRLGWVQTRNHTVPEPFILLTAGRTRMANEREAVIVSPVIEGETIVVGFGDNSVTSFHRNKMDEILATPGWEKPQALNAR